MNKPEVIIISALAESNRVIGNKGKVPWNIPEDSKRFQELTLGYTVIMGRKTWEHDIEKSPLPQRRNIVISSSPQRLESEKRSDSTSDILFVRSLEEALGKSKDKKIFIVGGSSIYAEALGMADTLELTLVKGDFEGDTFFPEYQSLIGHQFELVKKEVHPEFRYETYKRISA